MTDRWMLGALAAGALLWLAALAAERVAGWFGLPRRWIWAAAMAGSLLLPAVALTAPALLPAVRLPAWTSAPHVESPEQGSVARPDGGVVAASIGRAPPSPRGLPAAFGVAWLAASLATLGALAWGQRRLRVACGPCVGRRVAGSRVLVSERAGPMVLGLLDPQIVLPRWALDTPEECGLIVRHEREHVFAGDPRLLALASLAVAALPWSPALWWQHRRLRLAVETDCDARVIAAGESRRRYGQVLLSAAAHPLILPRPSLAWGGPSSHLERRILAMTAARPRHRVLRAIPFAAVACAGSVAACGLASGGSGPSEAVTRTEARRDTVVRVGSETWWSMLQGRVVELDVTPDGLAFTLARADGTVRPGWFVLTLPRGGLDPPSLSAAEDGLMVGDVILWRNGPGYPGVGYLRVRRGSEVLDVRLAATRPPPGDDKG